ncbi:MAG: DUF5007 domain-containing protein [Chitinophagaceae bacterium]|nr:MAG: DUF5007 domain-containing protein [Chitinophagaceae bacterium]
MTKYINRKTLQSLSLIAVVTMFTSSCTKLPEARENIDIYSEIAQVVYQPTMGRNTVIPSAFSQQGTSYPATFKILNIRRRNGDDAPELRTVLPVKVWKAAYTGFEKSIEEIENKREIQNRPVFEIGKHSGDLFMWSTANSNFIRSLPDSGYLFDIEVSNSGGRRYFQNRVLQPFREVPYVPSNINSYTGMQNSPYVSPNGGMYMVADTSIAGVGSVNLSNGDVNISFNKIVGSNQNKLTFRFLNNRNEFINPDKFNDTDWKNLIHGFNMVKNAEGVTYDVAYPIPLAAINTVYTTGGGTLAKTVFRYQRLGFGNRIENNYLGLNFAIYEPGNWEIIIRFNRYNPKFD